MMINDKNEPTGFLLFLMFHVEHSVDSKSTFLHPITLQVFEIPRVLSGNLNKVTKTLLAFAGSSYFLLNPACLEFL